MQAQLFILTELYDACRQLKLHDDFGSPRWRDRQFFRACVFRLQRNDASAWHEFLKRLAGDEQLCNTVREMLIDLSIVLEVPECKKLRVSLPTGVVPFEKDDEDELLRLLNVRTRSKALFPHPWTQLLPHLAPQLAKFEDESKFIPPIRETTGQVMFVEMKPGPARIGRVRFSKTRKTIYYQDRKLQSLKGKGIEANYFDVQTAIWYWVSNCKKDGSDTLYPKRIEIDDNARDEYWTEIRKQPENKHITNFQSLGKYSKRRPS